MTPLELALLAVAVIVVSAFVRSALGFGDAVLAMPLLAAFLDLRTATPLVAFIGPTISILILARDWRKSDFKASLRLVAASLVGIPVGIVLLTRLPEGPLRIALGLFILFYGVYGLWRPDLRIRKEPRGLVWGVGFLAGTLGGAFNTNGPPVVVYGLARGWTPATFRATLQGYFLPTGLFILAGHGVAGLWTAEVLRVYLYSLPGLLLGVFLGGRVNRVLAPERFNRLVFIALAAMGALLFLRALRP
ncbi:MAG: sulfite exporter TauE/SafE family protein [Candidatus Aminicenantes bacterium]|nr:sulfite exporter TauE/SafE family protein [Candidatus Aminicenantes bacterium]